MLQVRRLPDGQRLAGRRGCGTHRLRTDDARGRVGQEAADAAGADRKRPGVPRVLVRRKC